MIDVTKVKLGKRAPKVDSRTLAFAKYTTLLPAPPSSCDFTQGKTAWGMMDNDALGDCVCAMCGHGVQIASLNSIEGEITPPDQIILSLYEKACGYVPGQPSTDQGCNIIDTLNYVRQNAPWLKKKRFGKGEGHKHPYQLVAYADPNPNNLIHIQQAIFTFQTLGIGLQMPITAQAQTGPSSVWDVVGNPQSDPNSQPGSWGGHAVIICAYDATTLTCITWGALQRMTYRFFSSYCDEAHALLYRARAIQLGAQFPAMLAQLEADLALVTN
jgi:hypothetical protein